MCSRRYAALLIVVLAFAAAVAAWGARTPQQPDRTIGFGQIRFGNTHGNGGPEWWAWKWQQERRQVLELRARLHARLEPIIQLAIDFLCVHTGEGSWTANTGNGYYGGLQFNLDFMRTYGARYLAAHGTADNWEPAEQIATAIVAHTTRGFTPWPNTARRCGLLK